MGVSGSQAGSFARRRRSFRGPSLKYRVDCTILESPPLRHTKTFAKVAFTPYNNTTVNCSLQSMECCVASHCSYARSSDLPRPFHSKNRIFREFVYVNRANRCVKQLTATQRRTILHNRKMKRRKNVLLLCCSSASVSVMT